MSSASPLEQRSLTTNMKVHIELAEISCCTQATGGLVSVQVIELTVPPVRTPHRMLSSPLASALDEWRRGF